MIDFEKTRAEITPYIETLIERWLSAGKRNGRYWMVGSLMNEPGESLAVDLQNGIWKDYATGEKGGDLISLWAAMHRIEQLEAAKQVLEQIGSGQIEKRAEVVKIQKDIPAILCPKEREADAIEHPTFGAPVAVFDYRTADGDLMYRVCRFHVNGKKETRPLSWTAHGWKWKAWPQPRPLYNLPEIKARPKAPVLVVEGEKAATAAMRLLPAYVVTCWPNGASAVRQAAWDSLRDRVVLMWPDADEPGFNAAADVAAVLKGVAKKIAFVKPPEGVPEGWDIADAEGWTTETAMAAIKSGLTQTVPVWPKAEQPPEPGPEPDTAPEPEPVEPGPDEPRPDETEPGSDQPESELHTGDNPHFRFLGYERGGLFAYYSNQSRQLVIESGKGHSKNLLMQLGPLQWWESEFPGSRSGLNQDAAVNWLFQSSYRAGIFTPDKARGVGAWFDRGRAVVHLGDQLVVNGKPVPLESFESEFIYERAPKICPDLDLEDTLSDAESRQLMHLCEMLPWADSLDGRLLAGWIAVAPVCGALRWRPHIWVTGERGSGKSWIYDNITVRALGGFAFPVALSTTEAGLRGKLKGDALPVVFEEAGDQGGKNGDARIQKVLELMRQSSTETTSRIVKGTADGSYQAYSIRSCFALQSINVDLKNPADESRVTVLSLQPVQGRSDRFSEIQLVRQSLLTDKYINRLHARIINMIPTIRANAETFALAGARVLASRRAGDQLGALLAGAYALHSTRIISEQEAETWVREKREVILRRDVTETDNQDEIACLRHIMAARVSVDTRHGKTERTLGELVGIGIWCENDDTLLPAEAAAVVRRYGIHCKNRNVCVSTRHPWIADRLQNTTWHTGWGRILSRIDGTTSEVIRFAPGVTTRAVVIPGEVFSGIPKAPELPLQSSGAPDADASYPG